MIYFTNDSQVTNLQPYSMVRCGMLCRASLYSQHYKGASLCDGWENSTENVQRTLDVVQSIADGIVEENLTDIVTGFGLLNEPFNCDTAVLRRYYEDALQIVRKTMGNDTACFIGDNFNAWQFNDGFWTAEETYHNTYLDTHPYHVFFEKVRSFVVTIFLKNFFVPLQLQF